MTFKHAYKVIKVTSRLKSGGFQHQAPLYSLPHLRGFPPKTTDFQNRFSLNIPTKSLLQNILFSPAS